MATFFQSKSATLAALDGRLDYARILPQYCISVLDWRSGKTDFSVLSDLPGWFSDMLIVRSCACTEDGDEASLAGHFQSVDNVVGLDALNEAIKVVEASFDDYASEGGHIFIQPMLKDVQVAGVALTADLDTLAPYYVINYDDSGSTNSITSGETAGTTKICYKNAVDFCSDNLIKRIIVACQELEQITKCNHLDIEFAVNQDGDVYILQVRKIVVANKANPVNVDRMGKLLSKLYLRLKEKEGRYPGLLGDKAIYGLMPDWNPAEIIGTRPHALAMSLYRELITDSVWAFQRQNYGYRNLRSHPLLLSFLGIPYIDVRVSFNSFVPATLHEGLAERLINHYIEELRDSPHFHDKVEFEIVHSCYYLNLPERLEELRCRGFSRDELFQIEQALLELTNQIIDPERGLFKGDLAKIENLKSRHQKVMEMDLPLPDKIYWLLEDCKRYGTLPFAGIARAAFIAMQILNSFVDVGIFSDEEREKFLGSFKTVSKQLTESVIKVFSGEISREQFFAEYGHLRPGTYDLLSPRYDQAFDTYFVQRHTAREDARNVFNPSEQQIKALDKQLKKHRICISASALLEFIRQAVEGREYAKLVFTRSLSDALVVLENYGKELGIDHEDLVHLDIRLFLDLYAEHHSLQDLRSLFVTRIQEEKERYQDTCAVRLPPLIVEPNEIFFFNQPVDTPNFISLGEVVGETVGGNQLRGLNVKGKIALIHSADPGYDYLFTQGISGLITQFGGANSHMAIRCAELGLPAVIGTGEANFKKWSKAKILVIRAADRKVDVVS